MAHTSPPIKARRSLNLVNSRANRINSRPRNGSTSITDLTGAVGTLTDRPIDLETYNRKRHRSAFPRAACSSSSSRPTATRINNTITTPPNERAITSSFDSLSVDGSPPTRRKRSREREDVPERRKRAFGNSTTNLLYDRQPSQENARSVATELQDTTHVPSVPTRLPTASSLSRQAYPVHSGESGRRGSIESISSESSDGTVQALEDMNDGPDFQETGSRRIPREVVLSRIADPESISIQRATYNNVRCGVGSSVELSDGAFMRVKKIYQDGQGNQILVGFIFTRVDRDGLTMPKHRTSMKWVRKDEQLPDTRFPLDYRGHKLINELVQKILIQEGEDKKDYGLWRRPIQDVVRQVTLEITDNHNPDSFSYGPGTSSQRHLEDIFGFTCRWKDVLLRGNGRKWKEYRIEQISLTEADKPYQVRRRPPQRGPAEPKPYTFVDAFCSAGGVSTGAREAGLSITFAFDKDDKKMATYQANFGNLNNSTLTMGVDEFIAMVKRLKIRVDVLHLSPPCQPFSQANSTPNERKNEMNQPPLLACGELIKLLKPRIVTVEEAPGIRMRHQFWFNALINQFTELGYSLRWRNIKCADFGVPQLRQRLMIIAAAPGEILPHFPEPTHEPGQCSIRRTLEELTRFAADNDVTHHNTWARAPTRKAPYDANILAKTITTSGGQNYHPSGLRDFTIREYASLQTFPFRSVFGKDINNQEFSLSELKTQIGNAVPPAVSTAIYKSIVRSLQISDERARTANRARNENVITLE